MQEAEEVCSREHLCIVHPQLSSSSRSAVEPDGTNRPCAARIHYRGNHKPGWLTAQLASLDAATHLAVVLEKPELLDGSSGANRLDALLPRLSAQQQVGGWVRAWRGGEARQLVWWQVQELPVSEVCPRVPCTATVGGAE